MDRVKWENKELQSNVRCFLDGTDVVFGPRRIDVAIIRIKMSEDDFHVFLVVILFAEMSLKASCMEQIKEGNVESYSETASASSGSRKEILEKR